MHTQGAGGCLLNQRAETRTKQMGCNSPTGFSLKAQHSTEPATQHTITLYTKTIAELYSAFAVDMTVARPHAKNENYPTVQRNVVTEANDVRWF